MDSWIGVLPSLIARQAAAAREGASLDWRRAVSDETTGGKKKINKKKRKKILSSNATGRSDFVFFPRQVLPVTLSKRNVAGQSPSLLVEIVSLGALANQCVA